MFVRKQRVFGLRCICGVLLLFALISCRKIFSSALQDGVFEVERISIVEFILGEDGDNLLFSLVKEDSNILVDTPYLEAIIGDKISFREGKWFHTYLDNGQVEQSYFLFDERVSLFSQSVLDTEVDSMRRMDGWLIVEPFRAIKLNIFPLIKGTFVTTIHSLKSITYLSENNQMCFPVFDENIGQTRYICDTVRMRIDYARH